MSRRRFPPWYAPKPGEGHDEHMARVSAAADRRLATPTMQARMARVRAAEVVPVDLDALDEQGPQ